MGKEEITEDIGVVTAVQDNRITVEIAKGGGCKSCSMYSFCGGNESKLTVNFNTDGGYRIGDKVKVDISAGIRVLSSLIIFGLPLVALFAFFLIARQFTSEPYAILIGFGGLLLSFLIVKILDKKMAKRINYRLGGKCDNLPE
ncbi:MAG TPA: SoxR reducing system RseC family protein [Candidatus Cloacimonadota bacterium]|nr:SoxR reducing system RseC family protein [Candidatus Cloacimonadota bacterium]